MSKPEQPRTDIQRIGLGFILLAILITAELAIWNLPLAFEVQRIERMVPCSQSK